MSVAWVAVGATVANGVMGAQAAGDAADAQAESAAKSDATQRYQYDTTRADNAPFLANGTAASNRLSYLMGLSPTQGGTGANAIAAPTRESLRSELAPRYTTGGGIFGQTYNGYDEGANGSGTMTPGTVDEAGLNAEIERRLGQYQQQQAAQTASASSDPAFGSLTRNFTMADRDADPVYQSGLEFGLNEGTKGINRMQAARGSFMSGATLKALTRFGNDYGSTKANESYNRFNNNNTQQYKRLAGIAGSGQTASNQVGAAGQNMANNISASQQGVGNARASGYIGGANALSGALGSGYNMYQGNRLMDMYGQRTSGSGSSAPTGYDAWQTSGNGMPSSYYE